MNLERLTFATEEEIVNQREDQGDAFDRVLQVAEDSVLIKSKGDDDTRESIDQAYLQQGTTRYLDFHAVWNQCRWW